MSRRLLEWRSWLCVRRGLIVLVNWTGETNTPTTGNEAALLFEASAPRLRVLERRVHPTYRLDVLKG